VRILDRYVVRNFLATALLALVVLLSMRVVADLFVNIDDFTKTADKSALDIVADMWTYYSLHVLTYFRELGGVIIVASAAFTLARMNRSNELTAILASGVSLRRVLLPVVICAVGMNVLVVLDTEQAIPALKTELAVQRGDVRGAEPFQVRLFNDGQNNCWFSPAFRPKEKELEKPLVVLRNEDLSYAGHISAPKAQYDGRSGSWVFLSGLVEKPGQEPQRARLHVPGWLTVASPEFVPTRMGAWGAVYGDEPRINTIVRYYLEHPDPKAKDWYDELRRTRQSPLPMQNPPPITDAATNLVIKAKRIEFGKGPVEPVVLRDAVFEYAVGKRGAKVMIWAPQATFSAVGQIVGWQIHGGGMSVASDLTPTDLSLRQSSDWLAYMSTAEVTELLHLENIPDRQHAEQVRHTRFADLFNNLLMLLVATPFILSRERNLKASAGLTVLAAGGVYIFIYFSRYIGLDPVLSAWLPILVFGPVSAVMIESIKT
jgi:lipopolysaccharide export LptBFGC system permease protein LptF